MSVDSEKNTRTITFRHGLTTKRRYMVYNSINGETNDETETRNFFVLSIVKFYSLTTINKKMGSVL